MLTVPNSSESVTCFAWMQYYFDLIGDAMPNKMGEIHLEPVEVKEVWKEYCIDMNGSGEPTLSLSSFRSIWNSCFQHVKIREFKAVTGASCNIVSFVWNSFSLYYVRKMHHLRPIE